jgi:hypothetical protein
MEIFKIETKSFCLDEMLNFLNNFYENKRVIE